MIIIIIIIIIIINIIIIIIIIIIEWLFMKQWVYSQVIKVFNTNMKTWLLVLPNNVHFKIKVKKW